MGPNDKRGVLGPTANSPKTLHRKDSLPPAFTTPFLSHKSEHEVRLKVRVRKWTRTGLTDSEVWSSNRRDETEVTFRTLGCRPPPHTAARLTSPVDHSIVVALDACCHREPVDKPLYTNRRSSPLFCSPLRGTRELRWRRRLAKPTRQDRDGFAVDLKLEN
uniref:Uncharacterized protein n=1 Tax=Brassica campestris TaxID=3711 RepID=A0A3P5ZF87_BRACM|nr:unnamed protein product [Brassica rapa]